MGERVPECCKESAGNDPNHPNVWWYSPDEYWRDKHSHRDGWMWSATGVADDSPYTQGCNVYVTRCPYCGETLPDLT